MRDLTRFEVIEHGNVLPAAERERILSDPGFGTAFTDHMITLRWNADQGWHDGKLEPLSPLQIHPANAILHYAQEIFEGMKAYRAPHGGALLFRPIENARRFQRSAQRMAMPSLPEELFLDAVEALVRIDAAWIPRDEGALYLRPFMFADDVFLGVRPASRYTFCVIASPAGAYFKGGTKPITVWVSENFSRAGSGGTGTAKCGGNYAGSLIAQAEATSHGCDQVVFLDAAQGRWVEELGGMNIFFVMRDGAIVTPPLGTILAGITRDAVMQLAGDVGLRVEERPYSFDEWRADAASGLLTEAFACGTAAVLAPIGVVRHAGGEFSVGDGDCGPVTARIRETLIGIQRGQVPDPRGWRHPVALSPSDRRS